MIFPCVSSQMKIVKHKKLDDLGQIKDCPFTLLKSKNEGIKVSASAV